MDKQTKKMIPAYFGLAGLILLISLVLLVSTANADQASSSASVGNALPSSAVTIADTEGHVTLTADTTKTVTVNVVVTDNNGCEEVDADEYLTGKIYKTASGDDCSADNNNCYALSCTYTAESCTAGGTDLTAAFVCTASIYYYADPAEWTASTTPNDAGGSGTADTDTTTIDTLTAINLKDVTIAFGAVSLGGNTNNTNQQTTVSNAGNEQIDVQLDGYGTTSGDGAGKAMDCTVGAVDVGYEKYLATAFDYDEAGTALTDTAATLQLNIAQRTDDGDETAEDEEVYWGFGLPASGVSGTCAGKVNFTAVSG